MVIPFRIVLGAKQNFKFFCFVFNLPPLYYWLIYFAIKKPDNKWFLKARDAMNPNDVWSMLQSYYSEETLPGFAVPALSIAPAAINKMWRKQT